MGRVAVRDRDLVACIAGSRLHDPSIGGNLRNAGGKASDGEAAVRDGELKPSG